MGFDASSRITSVGTALTASYRADGMRATKSTGGAKTYYLYDGNEPIVELDATSAVKATTVYALDGLVGRSQGGAWTQYCFDPDGNVAQRLSSAGAVQTSSAYDAYGAESSAGAPTDPFGYRARAGYVLDRETGLYLAGHRYYDPGAGRWLNRDPIGAAGGINVYGYCAGNPVGRADPQGLQTGFSGIEGDPSGQSAQMGQMAVEMMAAEAAFDAEVSQAATDLVAGPYGSPVPQTSTS